MRIVGFVVEDMRGAVLECPVSVGEVEECRRCVVAIGEEACDAQVELVRVVTHPCDNPSFDLTLKSLARIESSTS